MTALVKSAFNSLFGSIKVSVPPPTCGDSTGVPSTIEPANGFLEVCTQNGPASTIVLKLKSFLAFPMDLPPVEGITTKVTPPGDLYEQIAGDVNNASNGNAGGSLLAAGSEADITMHPAPGTVDRISTELDTVAYLASIIESGVNVLTVMEKKLGQTAKASLDALNRGKCSYELGQVSYTTTPVSVAILKALTQVAFDCASSVVDLAATGVVQGVISSAAGLIENALQAGFGAIILIAGGPFGTTTCVTVGRTSAVAAPAPVLGAPFASYATGFGGVKPPSVQFGGDGYSQASNITWQSWGGTQAVGTGTGWYVPSGQSQNSGFEASITVVAFNLGTCGGVSAYQSFSWYFPQNGGTFDPAFYLNACTGQLAVPVAGSPTGPAFQAALAQWNHSWDTNDPTVDAADQGTFWNQAASDLVSGIDTDGGNTLGYAAAASALQNLAPLPLMGDTTSQMSEDTADVTALNAFFGTNVPT